MKQGAELNLIDLGGSSEFDLNNYDETVISMAKLLYLKIAQQAESKQVINTGNMISDENFKQEFSTQGGVTTLDMFMIYYADFVNKGVKGVKSSANAPNSPYQYKTLGMAEAGRKSILRAVQEGKIKISDTSKTRYGRIGLERKAQKTPNINEINEREAARIAYLIKAFGIKTTNFIDIAWEEWKKEITPALTKAATIQLIALLKGGIKKK